MNTKLGKIQWEVAFAHTEGTHADDGHADWHVVLTTTSAAKATVALRREARKRPGVLCSVHAELRISGGRS